VQTLMRCPFGCYLQAHSVLREADKTAGWAGVGGRKDKSADGATGAT